MADIIKTIGQSFSTDDIGVTTWTCRYYVAAATDYHKAGEEPPVSGLVETSREGQDQRGMGEGDGKEGMIVSVTYEGIVEPKYAGIENARIEFDASYTEEPLESHPMWFLLKKVFQASYDEEGGKVVFPESLPKDSSGVDVAQTFGLRAIRDTQTGEDFVKNPMFGEETFLSLGAVFRRTYAVSKIPDYIINTIGTVYEKLPDEFGSLDLPSGKRNWMQQPFKLTRRGGAYVITDELLQSPIGGWNEVLYRRLQQGTR